VPEQELQHLPLISEIQRCRVRAHHQLIAHHGRDLRRRRGAADVLEQSQLVDTLPQVRAHPEQAREIGGHPAGGQARLQRHPHAHVGGQRDRRHQL
jgi:hypothetical protein